MRDYRCGSIWLVNFDSSRRTDIKKTRPALIISPSDFNQIRSKVTLLPISSTLIQAKKIASVVVQIKASSANGLKKDSTIIPIQPSTFGKGRLIKYLGQVEETYLTKVKSVLQFYFDL